MTIDWMTKQETFENRRIRSNQYGEALVLCDEIIKGGDTRRKACPVFPGEWKRSKKLFASLLHNYDFIILGVTLKMSFAAFCFRAWLVSRWCPPGNGKFQSITCHL